MTEISLSRETIASIVHLAVRAWNMASGDTDTPTWDNAPDWAKTATRLSVDYVLRNPHCRPAELHAFWKSELSDREEQGRPPQADDSSKLGDYDDLLSFEKAKDILIIDLVNLLSGIDQKSSDHTVVGQ